MKNTLLLLLTLSIGILKSNAQCTDYVNIPDINFKNALLNDHNIDLDNDGEISCTEAANFTSIMNVNNQSISDLTGIEAFTALTFLNCSNNNLTSIDISNNTALTVLNCYSNSLESLDISNNTALISLSCYFNNLTSLDVSNNTVLEKLGCQYNSIESLDVSNNTALTDLTCTFNFAIDNLDLSNNLALEYLSIGLTAITSIDISNNTALEVLRAQSLGLETLDISNNTALFNLKCDNNNLTSLDLSNHLGLTTLDCSNNELTTLNIANGNNSNLNTGSSDFSGNPGLTCIEVDDAVYADTNWSSFKDATATYSENCSSLALEEVFSQIVNIYPNPTKAKVTFSTPDSIKQIEIFTIGGRKTLTSSNTTINISHLPSGLYLAKITTPNGRTVFKKIIKN